ncbi:hypothetical protein AALP_AA7G132900 [Arabis alpina]|uniref:BHLH domain-containing protein n=1 Tax=Arabis alpina TaxID=50452 RepID=A0A087GHS2_ARAAL|nr:hypothetical protein AALP_AA7G132900 [Arabis alpina]
MIPIYHPKILFYFSSLNLINIIIIMGEDELLWKSGQAEGPTSDPPILRGSGSGGEGEGTAPFPFSPLCHQSLFFHEPEMASSSSSWLHHQSFYPGVAYTPAMQPQGSVSLAQPPPSAPYHPPVENLTGQFFAATRAENLMNVSSLRGNISGPSIPMVRELTQVGSSSATEYTPVTEGTKTPPTVTGGVLHTFVVPGLGRMEKAVVIETKAETEPVRIQPATETESADDKKREETEETEETEEAAGSTPRKKSRATEMHKLSARRRRERIKERMIALQELIPHCNASNTALMLDDAAEYMKSLQMQIQMMSMGCSLMPATYTSQFMPRMVMGMNRPPSTPFPGTPPFPSQAHMASLADATTFSIVESNNITAEFHPGK